MKTITLSLVSAVALLCFSCSTDDAVAVSAAQNPSAQTAKMASNQVMRSLAGTTWDFTIYNNAISWHANVTFYANGTTMYDEPEFPGQYTNYGTWTQVGNTVYYDLSPDIPNTSYFFTGAFTGNTMVGTYTFGTGPQNWTAVQL